MSDISEVKSLVEQIGRGWDEYKKANDARLEKLEKSSATSDYDAKLAKIDAALDAAQKRIDDAVLAAQRPQMGGDVDKAHAEAKSFGAIGIRRGGPVDAEGYAAYKGAFNAFVRAQGNLELLSPENRKAMIAGIDVEGGYLLPVPAAMAVVAKVREFSTMRGLASTLSISSNAAEGLVDRNDAAAAWVGEVASRPATDTPQPAKDRIEAFEMYSFPQVSQTLLEDAAVDVESWLSDKVGVAFAEAENTAFFGGNGVNKPRGITTYTTAATADSSRTWGQLEHVITGASGAWHTTKADPIIDLIAKFKPAYLQNARFVMNRATQASIRKLKEATSDKYLWEPSLVAGQPATLLGFPVVTDEQMPTIAAGSLSVALGDFSRGYLIVDRVGISVIRDNLTNKPYVGLYFRRRVGGAVRDFDAIKFIKFTN